MKKIILTCLLSLVTLTALAADPVLRFNLDSAGVATITPELTKGTPYDFRPYSASDGSLILGLTWIDGGRAQLAFYALPLKYSGDPMPVPPGPTPPPTPPGPTPPPVPPDPVAQKCQFIWIEETADSTLTFGQIRSSKAIRDYCKAGGHAPFFLDKDAKGPDGKPPAAFVKWLLMAVGKPLPFLIVTDAEGSKVLNGKGEVAPTTEEETLAFLKKYGGATKTPENSCKGEQCNGR